MNDSNLAKELDSLARTLRGMSYEAIGFAAAQLKLGCTTSLQALTLGDISRAIVAAQRAAGPRARVLRKDVYERRVENLSVQYAQKLCGLARAHAAPIAGDVLGLRLTGCPAGQTWYHDVVHFGDHTPIAAEVYAWVRAARDALRWLVPAYAYRALEHAANQRAGCTGLPTDSRPRLSDSWQIAERFNTSLDKWVDANATLRVRLDGGKVAQVWGIDPTPFAELVDAMKTGNADPVGIFGAPVATVP